MKNALLFTLLTFSTFLTHAQQPEKVIPFSKEASPFIRDIVLDQDKNTFIAGYFTSQITIGDRSYTTQGKSDILIAKYSEFAASHYLALGLSTCLRWTKAPGGKVDQNSLKR